MVEEDMKENEKLAREGFLDKEKISVDELDMEGTGELDADAHVKMPKNEADEEDIEEYYYHDEASLSNNDIGHLRGNVEATDDDVKVANAGTAKVEAQSDIEEDYEF